MIDDLKNNRMMQHLLTSLERGEDIGHYGRLVFAMIARHFLSEDELVQYLKQNVGEEEARALCLQVQAHDYNPPRRERILQWQGEQSFPICPDGDGCNVYRDLKFPEHIYRHIEEFYEKRVSGDAGGAARNAERSLVDVDDRHQQREHQRSDDQAGEAERLHSA